MLALRIGWCGIGPSKKSRDLSNRWSRLGMGREERFVLQMAISQRYCLKYQQQKGHHQAQLVQYHVLQFAG